MTTPRTAARHPSASSAASVPAVIEGDPLRWVWLALISGLFFIRWWQPTEGTALGDTLPIALGWFLGLALTGRDRKSSAMVELGVPAALALLGAQGQLRGEDVPPLLGHRVAPSRPVARSGFEGSGRRPFVAVDGVRRVEIRSDGQSSGSDDAARGSAPDNPIFLGGYKTFLLTTFRSAFER